MIFMVASLVLFGLGVPQYTLAGIDRLPPKGRVQDTDSVVIERLIDAAQEGLEFLAGKTASDRLYSEDPYHRVVDYWPELREGDLALMIITSLFIGPDGDTTLPELCWDRFLEREPGEEMAAWDLVERFVDLHGRDLMRDRLREVLAENSGNLVWDEMQRFYRVEGLPLVSCSVERTGTGLPE
jgi:hypothetical protein